MILLNAIEEALEVALMFPCALVLISFKWGVLDVCAAVLAPVLWLKTWLAKARQVVLANILTVDFQCSAMSRVFLSKGQGGQDESSWCRQFKVSHVRGIVSVSDSLFGC